MHFCLYFYYSYTTYVSLYKKKISSKRTNEKSSSPWKNVLSPKGGLKHIIGYKRIKKLIKRIFLRGNPRYRELKILHELKNVSYFFFRRCSLLMSLVFFLIFSQFLRLCLYKPNTWRFLISFKAYFFKLARAFKTNSMNFSHSFDDDDKNSNEKVNFIFVFLF